MSNSSSVGGPGGVEVSPYTGESPDNADKTGQTNDHRKVAVNPDTGQTHIPGRSDDSGFPAPSGLAKRKVAHHPGSKKLKPMPDSGDCFKPLGSKGGPAGNKASPAGSLQRQDSLTGEKVPQPDIKPQVTVESTDTLKPLPPLTPEQQEQKNKLAGAFITALGFIKQHKNSFAMGGGAALMVVGIALMAFPPTAAIGILPAVLGFTMTATGFSFAMTNMGDGAPSPAPPEPPKNENKEEDDKKEKSGSEGDTPPASSSATPKGHFAKIDHLTGAPVTVVEPEETSLEATAKKRELLNLQRHMEADLKIAFQKNAEARAVSESAKKEASLPASLEDKILEIAAEYAIRAGLKADDDVMVNIVESGKLMARTMAKMEGMSQDERQQEFQALFSSLVQRPGIPSDALKLLYGAFDNILEEENDSLNEAAKAILTSTSALLKAITGGQSQSSEPSDGSPVSLDDLEAALDLDSVHDPKRDLKNIHHMRQLQDAIETQGKKTSMEQQEVDLIKKRLFKSSLGLLENSLSTADFKAALLAKVNPVTMPDEREFLDKALQGHRWFIGGS